MGHVCDLQSAGKGRQGFVFRNSVKEVKAVHVCSTYTTSRTNIHREARIRALLEQGLVKPAQSKRGSRTRGCGRRRANENKEIEVAYDKP